jgi:histidyl-tRNA synthetase
MNDILPSEISLWQEIERKARDFFGRYQYREIRTPILEEMSVFTRTVGETTDIVEKEMYTFQDRGGKWVALRPEGTASIVRAYIEHHLETEDPVSRFYYLGPMYRYDRPQRGRFREFHQLGGEVLGIASPRLDAEVMNMLDLFFRELGLKNMELEINSLGCPICRPKFQRAFFDFLHRNESKLCPDCRRRMERNPLRALDCQKEGCRALTAEGPSIQDYLCDACEKDFDTVLETLGLLGSGYKINQRIVRGLDYYLKTTFEFTSSSLGAQNAVAGGGRYDGLVRLMGGNNTPGFGFAVGLERLVEILREERKKSEEVKRLGVFIAAVGDKAIPEALKLAAQARAAGIAVDLDYEGKSLKSQMRRADRLGVRHVAILGGDELQKKIVTLRDLESGMQEEVPLAGFLGHLKKHESNG